MFDVDCPRTPDGDEPKKSSSARPPPNVRSNRHSSRSNSSANRSNANGTHRSSEKYTPRARSTSYESHNPKHSSGGGGGIRSSGNRTRSRTGLEPEEDIVVPVAHAVKAPYSGPPRAPTSGPSSLNFGNNGGGYHAAPNSGGAIGVGSGNNTNNLFADPIEASRRRTYSDSWWKEEIVEESMNKEDELDGYYGLSMKGKCSFYEIMNRGTGVILEAPCHHSCITNTFRLFRINTQTSKTSTVPPATHLKQT